MNTVSEEIFKLQNYLADTYKYKPLPDDKSSYYRKIWLETLPKEVSLEGALTPIYTRSGILLCSGYERIVIGDYGAFIEFSPEQANGDGYIVKEGQEYRINDPRYMNNVKYNWLTIQNTDIKIYEQKKTVSYADYKAGMYYVSPHEDLIFGELKVQEPLMICPFCKGKVHIRVCDDEGNLHDEIYEKNPWSGLGYLLEHNIKDVPNNKSCPIATYENEFMGIHIYDSRQEAEQEWNSYIND